MIKKRDLALETAAELFLTAFNGEVFEHGALEKIETENLPSEGRWFRQTFTGLTSFELFAGISAEAVAALPEIVDLLGNAFRAMVTSLGTLAGFAVSCGALTEEASPHGLETVSYELRRESASLGTVNLSVPGSTLSVLGELLDSAEARPASLHLDALMNVILPVSISFGSTEMQLADVLKLTTGSIVEFNHVLTEPVNVVVNDCLVARGDVVVVDGNYGVRISEVLSQS
jgi:flagellar motor switch protein FliN